MRIHISKWSLLVFSISDVFDSCVRSSIEISAKDCFCTHPITDQLLQHGVRRTACEHSATSSTVDQRCRSMCGGSRPFGQCNRYSQGVTLAPNQTAHHLQTVYHDARCPFMKLHRCTSEDMVVSVADLPGRERLRSASSGTEPIMVHRHSPSPPSSMECSFLLIFGSGYPQEMCSRRIFKTFLFNEAYHS